MAISLRVIREQSFSFGSPTGVKSYTLGTTASSTVVVLSADVVAFGTHSARPAVLPGKYAVPRLTSVFLYRPRLTAILDAAQARRVSSSSAGLPASARRYCSPTGPRGGRSHRVADPRTHGDNVDRRFWAAVLPRSRTGRRMRWPRWGVAPPQPPAGPPFLAAGLRDCGGRQARRVTLVLDDVDVLVDADPCHGLAALVRDRPPQSAVGARRPERPTAAARPAPPSGRSPVRAPALAFCARETAALLVGPGVALTPEQFDSLLTRRPRAGPRAAAGAALAMPARRPGGRPTDLVGNGPALADYLVAEILVPVARARRRRPRGGERLRPRDAPLAARLAAGRTRETPRRPRASHGDRGERRPGTAAVPRPPAGARPAPRRPPPAATGPVGAGWHGWGARHGADPATPSPHCATPARR